MLNAEIIKKIVATMNKDAVIRLVNEQMWTKTDVPSFQAGDTITVTYKIVEGNKERLQSFRGVVIQIKGTGKTKMFTIRKISNGISKKTLFRPGKHLVRHRIADFETPDNIFSLLPTDKTKIELRPALPRPTEEPHIPANTRPSAVRTKDDLETLRINSLPPKNKKVANEYRLQPNRPSGRLRREGDSNP